MRRCTAKLTLLIAAACAFALVFSRPTAAQDAPGGLRGQGPRFLLASPTELVPVDIDRTPMLGRRLALELDGVTLREALAEISAQSGLRLFYSDDIVPLDRRVRLRAEEITLAAALTDVLYGAGVDVVFSSSGRATLVKRVAGKGLQAGTISGRVTDAKNGEGLVGAEVMLTGGPADGRKTVTGEDGRYRLADVGAGSYTLAVRRIGYARQTQPVTVIDGQEVTVDVALEPRPTQLDEVVTTVTGDQRLRELGHVVGRINADSLVKEAPVSSLSDLLNGRVPGLQVFQSTGAVGGNVRLQVRGPNSLNLNTQPIVIIDGVRYTSQPTVATVGLTLMEPTSPLNDLNPNDIESIEVVKGPSAATLYGTDASNGVLVITTKRGRPGPARWNAYAKASRNEIPTDQFANLYWGWGTVNGVPDNATVSCTLERLATNACTQQDSVTVLPNPLNDPALTLFDAKPRWAYGANVAGGQQDLRYYFSGDFEDATGPVQMPLALAEQLRQQRGLSELPEEWREPNAFSKLNLRANVTAALGATADLQINTGYVHSATRALAQGFRSPYSVGAFTGTPTSPYAAANGLNPAEGFLQTSTDRTDRFFGNASAQWRPLAWLATRATVGLDLTGSNRYSLARRGDTPNNPTTQNGYVGEDRARQVSTTVDLGATVTAQRGRLSTRTAVGAQYVRTLNDLLSTSGFDLPPGGSSMGEAVTVRSGQTYAETVTLGSYLEETLGFNDRLFVTGALRVDGASAFGQDYDAAVYPKVSASWLLSEEPFLPRVPGLNELRLRYAYGASGQQPAATMARPEFRIDRAVENGAVINVVRLNISGNPAIRPERVREHEFGFDAAALGDRLRLGLTWYRRRTADQIVLLALPPGTRFTYTNLGLTTQHGFEAELTAQLLNTRLLSWDVTVQHGLHRTTLVDLGAAVENRVFWGGWAEGYSLGARFVNPVQSYADANGDGIIVRNEVQVDFTSPASYVGESTPPKSQTLTTVLGLFERRLRLSALLERRSGFTQVNQLLENQCGQGLCRERVDPSTPLAEQAAAWRTGGPLIEPGDFTRLREVTAALDVPTSLLRPLRLRTATLALSVRNLALWTDFSGPDPESVRSTATAIVGDGAEGVPQGRSWALRVDLGL